MWFCALKGRQCGLQETQVHCDEGGPAEIPGDRLSLVDAVEGGGVEQCDDEFLDEG
jgi:hypothetical protein